MLRASWLVVAMCLALPVVCVADDPAPTEQESLEKQIEALHVRIDKLAKECRALKDRQDYYDKVEYRIATLETRMAIFERRHKTYDRDDRSPYPWEPEHFREMRKEISKLPFMKAMDRLADELDEELDEEDDEPRKGSRKRKEAGE